MPQAHPFALLLASAAGLAAVPACSSSSSLAEPHDAATHVPDVSLVFPDTGHDAARPHDASMGTPSDSGLDAGLGAVSTTYPAFTPDLPQVVNNGGGVLTSPVIVTITWPASDPNVATWEAMSDGMGDSQYWKATTSPYGVGAATGGPSNHVHMTDALPASISYTDLATYVMTAATASPDAGATDGGTNPRWPAPTLASGSAQTIYSLFIPSSVSVTDPGSGLSFCDEGGLGYHDNVMVGANPVAYSITLECASQTLPDLEETLAHELVEAATNPYPSTNTLGYVGFDPDHLSWDLYSGFADELADACQSWADSYYQEAAPFPYWVQRSWSNANVAAGHDPCVPVPPGPYEGLTLFPSEETTTSVNLTSIGLSNEMTRAFVAKVGETVTFHVGFYSDAKTSGPWTIAYDFPATTALYDESGNPLGNGAATVSIDRTSGVNGEKALVSVTPTTAGPLGFQLMAITWDNPGDAEAALYAPHYLPVLIVNP